MSCYKITCSIVTYNHRIEEIHQLIISIISSIVVTRLFIIDNSPVNDLQSKVNYEKTEYVFLNRNGGYGAGHNVAIRMAIEMDSKYHIVINPDVNFRQVIIEQLVGFMDADPAIGDLMPKVLYPDSSLQYICKLLPTPYDWIGRRFNPFKEMVKKRNEIFELRFTGYDQIAEIPYLSGCFMFLRVGALKKIGLFDENIFMYGEETDLCRRLIAGGYKTIFYPEVFITHEFQKGSHKSWRLTWIGIKSAIYYFNKWGWFFDKERIKINQLTLQKFGYNK